MMLSSNICKLTDCSRILLFCTFQTQTTLTLLNLLKPLWRVLLEGCYIVLYNVGLMVWSFICLSLLSSVPVNISHEWHKGCLTHPKAEWKSVPIGPVVTIKLSQNVLHGLFLVIFSGCRWWCWTTTTNNRMNIKSSHIVKIIISDCRQTQKQYAD